MKQTDNWIYVRSLNAWLTQLNDVRRKRVSMVVPRYFVKFKNKTRQMSLWTALYDSAELVQDCAIIKKKQRLGFSIFCFVTIPVLGLSECLFTLWIVSIASLSSAQVRIVLSQSDCFVYSSFKFISILTFGIIS